MRDSEAIFVVTNEILLMAERSLERKNTINSKIPKFGVKWIDIVLHFTKKRLGYGKVCTSVGSHTFLWKFLYFKTAINR